jgi:probable HAF family extracellular repeat protein
MKRNKGMIGLGLAALALLGLAASRPVAAQRYAITQVGAGPNTQANAINDNGEVVGQMDLSGAIRAFSYSGGSLLNLGVLWPAGYAPFGNSVAYGVNNIGQVVGLAATPRVTSSGQYIYHAFLWNGVMSDLQKPTDPNGYARGINNSSQVVGYTWFPGIFVERAFLWQKGVMTDLGAFGSPYRFSHAYAINNSGQVVGEAGTDNGFSQAFLWQGGVMTNLGTFWPDPWHPGKYLGYSAAMAINNYGQVVGSSFYGSSGVHAFLWMPGHWVFNPITHLAFWIPPIRLDLGTLPGDTDSVAYAINDQGQVVGYSSTGSTVDGTWKPRAFLWDFAHGMRDLNSLTVNGLFGHLRQANAINNKGQVVGVGRFIHFAFPQLIVEQGGFLLNPQ